MTTSKLLAGLALASILAAAAGAALSLAGAIETTAGLTTFVLVVGVVFVVVAAGVVGANGRGYERTPYW